MILSDREIRDRLADGSLVIEPLDDPELQIQPASVDLRLGREFLEFRQSNIPYINPDSPAQVDEYTRRTVVEDRSETEQATLEAPTRPTAHDDGVFILHPDDFVLGTTLERVEIPDDLIAHVEGRSSLGRLAVVVHATAGLADPGFRGKITLELSNLGTAPVALKPGMRVSQLTFTELTSPAERPYGAGRGSKYQDQEGPQASRLDEDHEFGGDQLG
ncbi:MAG: dCTP deaminase [Halobacteriota archaeon]